MSYNNLSSVATLEIIRFLAEVWQDDHNSQWETRSSNPLELTLRRDQKALFQVGCIWTWDARVAVLEYMNTVRDGGKCGIAAVGDVEWARKAVHLQMVNGKYNDGIFFYGGWWPLQEEVWDDNGFGCQDTWLFMGRNDHELDMAYQASQELYEHRTGEFARWLNGGLPWGACNNI